MEAFSTRPVGELYIRNLNKEQKLAHACLQTRLKQILLDKFNRKTYINNLTKSTNLTYRVKMKCTKRCNFSWIIILNIKSKNVSMFKNRTICDHFVDSSD